LGMDNLASKYQHTEKMDSISPHSYHMKT